MQASHGAQDGVVVAFALRFSVRDGNSTGVDKRILPVFYSDNWFSLVPYETATIDISFKVSRAHVLPQLVLSGWNVTERIIPF